MKKMLMSLILESMLVCFIALHMSSDRYGEYVIHLSEDTLWIDSGNRTASDPATLKEGEELYVFHSPVSTRSLPPQGGGRGQGDAAKNQPQERRNAHVPEQGGEGDAHHHIRRDIFSSDV